MIQNVLRNLGGIEIYGLISLGLFLAVFIGMLIWVFRLKRARLDRDARLPLDPDSEPRSQGFHAHE